jgi:hypothetical protein
MFETHFIPINILQGHMLDELHLRTHWNAYKYSFNVPRSLFSCNQNLNLLNNCNKKILYNFQVVSYIINESLKVFVENTK